MIKITQNATNILMLGGKERIPEKIKMFKTNKIFEKKRKKKKKKKNTASQHHRDALLPLQTCIKASSQWDLESFF